MKSSKKKTLIQSQKVHRLRVRSRHPTHNALRGKIIIPKPAVIRFGSTTETPDNYIEVNSIQAVKNSANKLLMKQCFTEAGVRTARWWTIDSKMNFIEPNGSSISIKELPYPVIVKHIYGSRGTGNYLINNPEEFEQWIPGKKLANYIVERYVKFLLEFRLHVTKDGCFYACRKALKLDAEGKWQRHADNTTWYLDTNEKFFRPNSWDEIVSDCVKALKAIGADVLAFDVKVQSNRNGNKEREYQDFIIIESNSAPSLAEVGVEKYKEILPKLIEQKYELSTNKP